MRLRGRVKLAARVLAERELFFVHPGHFYSPILAVPDRAALEDLVAAPPRGLRGIDLREDEQVHLLEQLADYCSDLPFTAEAAPGLRYHYDNDSYRYSDGIVFSAMLRHFKPRRLIEVGSGHSSALALDVNDRFVDGRCEMTFVEPRAFLSFNSAYRILLFNTFLAAFHREWFESNMPQCLEDPGGSIWLERLK